MTPTTRLWNRLALVALVAALTAAATAQTTRNVPSLAYPTIQDAINASVSGDTVEIDDGVYTGLGNKNLTFGGRAITVRSASGNPAACIIDCQGSGRGVSFGSSDVGTLEGLTITNGNGFSGGGIVCQNGGSPTLSNCVISNCFSSNSGGGFLATNGSNPTIQDCTFSQNHSEFDFGGGGIALQASTAVIERCVFTANTVGLGAVNGGGVALANGSSATISKCTFSQNSASRGGGLALVNNGIGVVNASNCLFVNNVASGGGHGGGALFTSGGDMSLVNCTLADNSAISGAAGGALFATAGTVTFANCIAWGDTAPETSLISGGSLVATYSDIAGVGVWPGTNNINADPQFTSPGTGDYTLAQGSPCINAGDDAAVAPGATDLAGEVRVAGAHVDIGAYEFGFFDADEDGLSDTDEAIYGTNPNDPDTDDDGLLDGTEVDSAAGSGCPDPLDADSDDDTLLDGAEVGLGTNPCNADTDGDGIPDNIDPLPADPGGTTNFLEDSLRTLSDDILDFDLSSFTGRNDNANRARRAVLANRANAAANQIAAGHYDRAIQILQNLQIFVDGVWPPEWMEDGPDREHVFDSADLMIAILGYL